LCNALIVQCLRAGWLGLRRPFLPTLVEAVFLSHLNTGDLTLTAIFQLDFGQAEHDAGDHATDRATQVDLLGDSGHSHAALAPICQQIDPVALPARNPIRLLNYNRFDGAPKDAF
jgi:hypothetical protein